MSDKDKPREPSLCASKWCPYDAGYYHYCEKCRGIRDPEQIMTEQQLFEELDPAHHDTVRRWLDRGDGVAVYENAALDSANLGHRQYVSFGSPAAQIEESDPPKRLPDIGGAINWKYQLAATVLRSDR